MAYSFSLDGVRSETPNLIVNDVQRMVLPEAIERKLRIPSRIGDIYFRTDLRLRQINIDYTLTSDSFADLPSIVRDLATFLDPTKGLRDLIFDDDPTIKYKAVLDKSTDFNQIIKFGQGTLNFIVPNGVGLSITDETIAFSGFNFTITRVGTAPSFPKFTVLISAGNFSFVRITLVETGKFVESTTGAAVGPVTFNFDHEINELNIDNVKSMPLLDLVSEFFTLEKGTNTFLITTDAAPINVSGSLTYTPRWL